MKNIVHINRDAFLGSTATRNLPKDALLLYFGAMALLVETAAGNPLRGCLVCGKKAMTTKDIAQDLRLGRTKAVEVAIEELKARGLFETVEVEGELYVRVARFAGVQDECRRVIRKENTPHSHSRNELVTPQQQINNTSTTSQSHTTNMPTVENKGLATKKTKGELNRVDFAGLYKEIYTKTQEDPAKNPPELFETFKRLVTLRGEHHKHEKITTKKLRSEWSVLADLIRIDNYPVDDITRPLLWVYLSDDEGALFWREQVKSFSQLRRKSKNGSSKFSNLRGSYKGFCAKRDKQKSCNGGGIRARPAVNVQAASMTALRRQHPDLSQSQLAEMAAKQGAVAHN